MPNIITIALGLMLASYAPVFAQAANGPPKSLATQQAAPEAAQKRTADAQDKDLQERNARPRDIDRDTDRPAIGPSTTQGLAQDSITRSNRR